MPGYTYDPVSSRYRATSGRYVSPEQLHSAVVKMADASSQRLAALATRLQSGSLSLADFQAGLMAEVKTTHLAAAMAAHGGRNMMSQADYGYAGSQIKAQYQYARAWVQDIASGAAPLDGRLVARAKLYGRASVGTFDAVQARDARNSGALMEERNVLHSGDPCQECPSLSAQGWVSLGTLPRVGQRVCKANCKCSIERRSVA